MTIEEQVAELEAKMNTLRTDFAAGRISSDEIKTQTSSLMIRHLGLYWSLGFDTNQWYRYQSGQWWLSKSPLLVSQEELDEITKAEASIDIEKKVAALERKTREIKAHYESKLISLEQAIQLTTALVINYRDRIWRLSINLRWKRQREGGFPIRSKSPLLVSPEELNSDPSGFLIDDSVDLIELSNELRRESDNPSEQRGIPRLGKDEVTKMAKQILEENGLKGEHVKTFEPSKFGFWRITFQRLFLEELSALSFVSVYIDDEESENTPFTELHW